jgi:hypothetical protein
MKISRKNPFYKNIKEKINHTISKKNLKELFSLNQSIKIQFRKAKKKYQASPSNCIKRKQFSNHIFIEIKK